MKPQPDLHAWYSRERFHCNVPIPKGLDPTALREIKLLRELQHDNIIRLIDAYPKKKSVVLVRVGCGQKMAGICGEPRSRVRDCIHGRVGRCQGVSE